MSKLFSRFALTVHSLPGACLLVLGGLFATGCSTGPAVRDSNVVISIPSDTTPDDAQSPGYRIRPGDRVSIHIPENRDHDTSIVVSPNGTILLRLIGELRVSGLNRAELADSIAQRLSVFIKSKITPSVDVRNQAALLITVLGAVGNQGVFPLSGEVPVIQAIANAGGSTVESDLRHIKVFKKGHYDTPLEFDLTTKLAAGTLSAIPHVGPGDTVFVPREENVIRELSGFFRDVIFLFGILGFFQ